MAVEADDAAMEDYLEGVEITTERLKGLIRTGCIGQIFTPILLGKPQTFFLHYTPDPQPSTLNPHPSPLTPHPSPLTPETQP